MVGIVAFHFLMSILAVGIATGLLSVEGVSNVLGYVHTTIGITTPPRKQVRTIALIWIGSTVVIVDGCLLLLVFIASQLR